jgi:ribA/ribD-fused uncharacterized protein
MTKILFNSRSTEYGWLSNFHPAPVEYQGKVWPTVEHAYQAAKTLVPAQQERIRQAATPAEAKKIGRVVSLRSDWGDVRGNTMLDLLVAKFRQHQELLERLLATGDLELVEHSPWGDGYWGDGGDGTGSNRLGRFLMAVRFALRTDQMDRELQGLKA